MRAGYIAGIANLNFSKGGGEFQLSGGYFGFSAGKYPPQKAQKIGSSAFSAIKALIKLN